MDGSAQNSNTSSMGQAPGAAPLMGGGANGDQSTITGDTPMQNLPSNEIVAQKEALEATNVVAANTAQAVQQSTAAAQGAVSAPASPGSATPVQVPPDKSVDQIQQLKDKLAGVPLPADLKLIIDDRVARLELIKSGSGYMSSNYIIEYESTLRYVNWTTGLPWNRATQDLLDLKKAREVMDKYHYGLEMLKQRVLEYIASIMLNIQNNGPDFMTRSPILCFVGLAGTGKTTFAKSIAEALGRQFERIPFGGMADSRVLRGQSRFFPDAEPGQVIKRLVHAGAKNPVILLDELDRVTETARADIMGVLIELLDPEQNSAFSDHYIDYPFSLSNSLFVATANNLTSVSTAVLDRLEIIQMPSYNDEEKTVIGRDYVLPKTRSLIGLKPDQLTIDDAVWEGLIRPLGYDPGVRGLERLINMMCRKAATTIVMGEAMNVRITPDNVKKYTQDF